MVGERGKPWQRKPATAWPQLHRLIARLNILNCIGLLVLEILEKMGPDCPGTIKKKHVRLRLTSLRHACRTTHPLRDPDGRWHAKKWTSWRCSVSLLASAGVRSPSPSESGRARQASEGGQHRNRVLIVSWNLIAICAALTLRMSGYCVLKPENTSHTMLSVVKLKAMCSCARFFKSGMSSLSACRCKCKCK